MNIVKYAGYFHDGTIHEIFHHGDKIIMSMESSELIPEWNEDNLLLSKLNRISGKLHANKLISIFINNVKFDGVLKKTSDTSDVSNFSIKGNKILIKLYWITYTEKFQESSDLITIEIVANEIYWENIPTLFDAYWDETDSYELS